jgi:transcription factor E
MLEKFLKDVIVIVVGKQAEEIANLLNNKKHVNEFIIAKKLDITINQTRNILYKISDHGLVSFIRKKDKKKGWYTYFWRIEVLKSLEFLKSIFVKRIDQINHQIKSREAKRFYSCERCNIEFNEENALLHNFTCDECGDIFVVKDNTKVLKEFNRNLDKLKKELEFVNIEITKEKEKLAGIKFKEFKKEEKIAAEKKAEKKLLREIAKKKLVKKNPKKIAKKKKKIAKKKGVKKKKTVKKIPKKKVVKKNTKKSIKKVVKKK